MNFENLTVRNFRNIKSVVLPFHPRFNLFVGDNGQGKTNLIEALYFLLNGKSFRTSAAQHFLNYDEPQTLAQIRAIISRGLLSDRLDATISAQQRLLQVNQKRASVQNLCTEFPTLVFSPESLVAIKSGPEHRRELLDEAIAHSREFGAQLTQDYRKVLQSRNRLLKDTVKGLYSRATVRPLLESLDISFLRAAVALTSARIEMLEQVNPIFQEVFRSLIQSPNVEIHVDYVISDEVVNRWSMQKLYSALSQSLETRREIELATGTTLVGPHKHDVRFLYNGNDSRFFCSQGQQRALILAFKITQIVYHIRTHDVSPILFLDDVLSELDATKRTFLLRFLRDHDSQTFITTTDVAQLGDFDLKDLGTFHVRRGQVDDELGNT